MPECQTLHSAECPCARVLASVRRQTSGLHSCTTHNYTQLHITTYKFTGRRQRSRDNSSDDDYSSRSYSRSHSRSPSPSQTSHTSHTSHSERSSHTSRSPARSRSKSRYDGYVRMYVCYTACVVVYMLKYVCVNARLVL